MTMNNVVGILYMQKKAQDFMRLHFNNMIKLCMKQLVVIYMYIVIRINLLYMYIV